MNRKTSAGNWNDSLKKNLPVFIGTSVAILAVILLEGSIIAATKLFGVIRSTLLRVVFTIPLSWFVIYLATRSKKSLKFTKWFEEKQSKLSGKAKAALEGGKFLVVINTAIFLGPIVASILMLMIGVAVKRIYVYAVLCALLSAWLWSAFYGSLLCQLSKLCP